MANKVHFNPFIFSLHFLWTLSYLSSILDSFHLIDILIFSLRGSLRPCSTTVVRVQQANHHPYPYPTQCARMAVCTLMLIGSKWNH